MATFSGINKTYGFKGILYSVELTDLKDSHGNIVKKYLCINKSKAFDSVSVGDTIEFSGMVERNKRKYNQIIKELYTLGHEYKITRISKMRRI